jgi:hypothetical protein
MRKTTNFKRFQSGGAVLAEAPSPEIAASINTDASLSSEADEASRALQAQISALRESERLQRERNTAPALTARQAAFVQANPDFMKNPEIARESLMAAYQAGHEQDSDAFHRAVKANFDARMMPRPNLSMDISIPERAPQLPSHGHDRMASYVSAPVSRETSVNGYDHGDRGSRVRLSIAQKEAARIAGITEKEYAEQVLRLRQEKRDGYHGGQS